MQGIDRHTAHSWDPAACPTVVVLFPQIISIIEDTGDLGPLETDIHSIDDPVRPDVYAFVIVPSNEFNCDLLVLF